MLQAAGSVFSCHASMLDTIWHSEIGASAALLEAGYNLDCLLAKYQGVDWRNSSFHGCNAGMNPMWEGRYDGISLNPLEQASSLACWNGIVFVCCRRRCRLPGIA